jgi:hypothetical protein
LLYKAKAKWYNIPRRTIDMNSFGHLAVSIMKSLLRIGACAWCIYTGAVVPLAIGFLAAEVLGIVEELVDKRA